MVISSISMDLQGCEQRKWIEVVQGDISSRKLKIALFSGKAGWHAPEGTSVLIRYKKENGAWGEYDTMPDGSKAWEIVENILTISIAPQMVSTPGRVLLSAVFLNGEAVLNSFSVEIQVKENIKGTDVRRLDEPYRCITGFLPGPDTAQEGQILQIAAVDKYGKVRELRAVDMPEGDGESSVAGYYTPVITQTDSTAMEISFLPSSPDMPAVEPTAVSLPAGKDGSAPKISIATGRELDGRKRVTISVQTEKPDGGFTVTQGHVTDGDTPRKNIDYFDGTDGKSAYAYAQEAGYAGTEEEFAAKLAEVPLVGSTADITPAQVSEALLAGRDIMLTYVDEQYGEINFSGFMRVPAFGVVCASGIQTLYSGGTYMQMRFSLLGSIQNGNWGFEYGRLADYSDVPAKLPNPEALTFSGAVTGTYDGSSAVTIHIPTVTADADASGERIPDYVRTEAEAVARTINQHQSNNSIVFPFLADAHCGFYLDTGNDAAVLAGQLLELIGRRVPYDFIVNGGDMANGAWDTTRDNTFDQYEDYSELTAAAHKGIPAVWVPGNHDDAPYMATADRLTQRETFALIGRKNRLSGAVCPDGCNYGYLDLENQKLRIIYLDTDDKRSWGTVAVGTGETAPDYLNAHNLSGSQLNWFVSHALDFSGKGSASEWGIVLVSHVALNIAGTITDVVSGTVYDHSTENAAVILSAYKKGSSGSLTHNGITVSYDFSAVSRAAVICAVHGHNHKFSSETLTGNILSIGCPNVMNGRERESDDGNTYIKTAGTEDGTSFCVITIDRENNMIYADCVGVGPDRAFTYTTEAAALTNQIPVSTDTDGSIYNGVGYQSGYRLGSSGDPSEQSGSYLTGFIPCKVGDTIYMKNVTFQYGVTDGLASSNQRLSFYDSNKTHLLQTNATGLGGVAGGIKGDDGIWTQFTVRETMSGTDCSGVAYFRINGSYIGADSIITINETIE